MITIAYLMGESVGMEQINIRLKSHRYHEPVLIVEDSEIVQSMFSDFCDRIEIASEVAENGAIALEMLHEKEYAMFIVDLVMPVMDGKTFITHLKSENPDAVVIVSTSEADPNKVIEIMRMGVYDYIIKPIQFEIFRKNVLQAMEYSYLKKMERQQSLNAGRKIQNQIEWLNYKERRRMEERDTAGTKSIYSLKTSLAQGAGFGSLVTLIDLMQAELKDNDDSYIIDKEIVDMIIRNNRFCQVLIDGLNYAISILEQDFDLREHDSLEFIESVPAALKDIIPYLKQKNISLTYPETHHNVRLHYNKKIMDLIIEELVVNAYKYSKHNSTINIFCHISEGYFWFSVKNNVDVKPYGGIAPENEKLVLEPFFRLHPPEESVAEMEKIGFGLGLAVVDYVAKKHNGMFYIHNVKDMTCSDCDLCVLAELLLPIAIQ